MSDITEFEMSQDDLDRIVAACAPVPYLVFGGVEPMSPQERANNAWRELSQRLGFDFMTVRPSPSGDPKKFTALRVSQVEPATPTPKAAP